MLDQPEAFGESDTARALPGCGTAKPVVRIQSNGRGTGPLQGRANIVISADVFNALNNDTVQSIRRIQTANNANLISAIVAPRVVRFGARLTW